MRRFTILGCGSSLGSPWINKYKGKSFSDEKLIEILVGNEKLIERPIITFKNDGLLLLFLA